MSKAPCSLKFGAGRGFSAGSYGR